MPGEPPLAADGGARNHEPPRLKRNVRWLASSFGFRWIAYLVIGVLGLAAAFIHILWLPSHGINGWTGEPRDKYDDLLGIGPRRRDRPSAVGEGNAGAPPN